MSAVIGKAEHLYRHSSRENMVRCACGHVQKISIWSWAGHGCVRCKNPKCRAKIMYGTKEVIDDQPKLRNVRSRIVPGFYITDIPTNDEIRVELRSPDGDGCAHVMQRDKALKMLSLFLKRAKGE